MGKFSFRGVQIQPTNEKDPKSISNAFDAIQRGFDQVGQDLSALYKDETRGGVIVKAVAFVSGQSTTVKHGLGQKWRGWQIVTKDSFADFKADAVQPTPDRTLQLTANANVTADVRVFA